MIRSSTVALAALASLAVGATAFAAASIPAPIAAAVADAGRPAADKGRDPMRKPAEVTAFAGVRPGMKIAELAPGGGYYTRILCKAVGANGKIYALVPPAMASRPGALDGINAVAQSCGNVQVLTVDYTTMKLPEPVDLFWTTENYHDFHNGPTANIPALNKAVYDNLKPGGAFLVEDHSAKEGAGLAAASGLHRMDPALAKQELQAAGFRIDAESDLLRNPSDNRELGVREGSVQGHTDRFILRAKRP